MKNIEEKSFIREVYQSALDYLEKPEILLFIGARQAGKTTILKQLKSFLEGKGELTHFLNLEDFEYLKLLNESPKNIFKIIPFDPEKRNFVFIDEVQYLDDPSNFLKYLFDEHHQNLKLIVSGSSAFYLDEKFKDSMVGRKKIFNVFTLSFREFLIFKGEDALAKKDWNKLGLMENEKIINYFSEYCVYGGYPKVVLASLSEKKEVLREIALSYIKKDIYEAGIRQKETFYKVFRILASQTGNMMSSSELAVTLGVSFSAIKNYISVMQKSFHIYLLRPFFGNIRKEITRMPKVYFLDLGLRNFFVGNFENMEIRADKGPLLENAVLRLLLDKYSEGALHYWRTSDNNEIDFITEDKKTFEVKFSPSNFKKSKQKEFYEKYPEYKNFIVTLHKKEKDEEREDILNAWQV